MVDQPSEQPFSFGPKMELLYALHWICLIMSEHEKKHKPNFMAIDRMPVLGYIPHF